MQPDPVWTAQDLAGTLRTVEPWWDLAVAGLEPPLPAALVAARARIDELVAAVRDGDDPDARGRAGTALVAELSAAGRAALAALAGAGAEAGDDPDARVQTTAGLAAPTASARAGASAGVPLAPGRVVALHVSPGGVPKTPVPEADVGWRGLAGDRQATRRHHGRLWQAVCLWSAEVIDGLQREGHPIFPGAAGENVTVAGLDWAAVRPGLRLALGDAVVEVTVPALPCAANARWFADGEIRRIDHRRHPGSSRQYALVVRPGRVTVGDDVTVA